MSEASNRIGTDYDNPLSLFVSYAFSVTPEHLLRLQMDLKNLMDKYMALEASKGEKRNIAQACFQVFPVIT